MQSGLYAHEAPRGYGPGPWLGPGPEPPDRAEPSDRSRSFVFGQVFVRLNMPVVKIGLL